MITGSILGFLAVVMLLMSMPCISLGNEAPTSKNRRAVLGGVLILIVGKIFVDEKEQTPRCDPDLVPPHLIFLKASSLRPHTRTDPSPQIPSHSFPPPTFIHALSILRHMETVFNSDYK